MIIIFIFTKFHGTRKWVLQKLDILLSIFKIIVLLNSLMMLFQYGISSNILNYSRTIFISEPGLYELIFSSKLSIAKEFKNRVFEKRKSYIQDAIKLNNYQPVYLIG